MRAAILRELGHPLEIEETSLPDPQDDEVLVQVLASGVCHSDLSVAEGLLPTTLPSVLGHEGAGLVQAVGRSVRSVEPGDTVVLVWQGPCRRCPQCLAGQPHLCADDSRKQRPPRVRTEGAPVHSMNGLGTFAEAALVHERCLVRIESQADVEVAAVLGCAGLTGIGAAVHTAGVRAGDTVAVFGCGGVGLSAIQGARIAGARQIVALDPIAAKRSTAMQLGATDVADPQDAVNDILNLTGGIGVDHAIDCVGHAGTIAAAYHSARIGGTVTIVGVGPLGTQVPLTIGDLLKPRKVEFSVYGGVDAQRDVPRLLELERLGILQLGSLVSERVTLDDVNASLDKLRQGNEGRSVIRFDASTR